MDINMERRGKYIVIEGPRGAGKTTQLSQLAERMRAAGLTVRTISDPNSELDKTAQAICQLNQNKEYPKNPRSKLLLTNAARSQLLKTIRRELKNGVHCLVERNYLTTLTEQFYGLGEVPDYRAINIISDFAAGGLEPDLTIVLDAPAVLLKQRISQSRAVATDDTDEAYLERLRAGYLWEAKQRHYPVVYTNQAAKDIASQIWRLANRSLAVRSDTAATSIKTIIEARPELSRSIATEQPELSRAQPEIIGASDLLLTKLGRSASPQELEPSSIDLTLKSDHGHYRYYLPPEFKAPILKKYTSGLDQIFSLYSEMVEGLTKSISERDKTPKKQRDDTWRAAANTRARNSLQMVLPVATKFKSATLSRTKDLDSSIADLLADDLPEARNLGENLISKIGQANHDAARANAKTKISRSMQKLADKYLPPSHTSVTANGAGLVDYYPKNELDAVADMLYEHSDESVENLRRLVAGWSYDKKVNILKTYCGDSSSRQPDPGQSLEKVIYGFDVVCDYGIFRDLQRSASTFDLECQPLTPRYGYDIPKFIEEAGLTDKFEQCFDISLKLYSQLQAAGYPTQAQYATLLGHRMRWKMTCSARALFAIYKPSTRLQTYPGHRKVIKQLHELVASVHPLLADCMGK